MILEVETKCLRTMSQSEGGASAPLHVKVNQNHFSNFRGMKTSGDVCILSRQGEAR